MLAWLYDTFLTSRGRIGRLTYLGRCLLMFPVQIAGWIALIVLSMIFSIIQLGGLILFIGVPAHLIFTAWAHVALANRRYHDFGWSGKWQFVNLGLIGVGIANASLAISRLGGMAHLQALDAQQKLIAFQDAFIGSFSVISLAINAASLGMLLHLLFRRGDDGENRYDEESRLPGVFDDEEKSVAAPAARPAPAYRAAAATARKFGVYDGQPRAGFGLKS